MSRALHVFNFLCIISLCVLLTLQWKINDELRDEAVTLNNKLTSAEEKIDDLQTQVTSFQNESERLADALNESREQTQTAVGKHRELLEQYNKLADQARSMQDQLKTARSMIEERDARLRELAETLATAEQRLEEAAQRLEEENR